MQARSFKTEIISFSPYYYIENNLRQGPDFTVTVSTLSFLKAVFSRWSAAKPVDVFCIILLSREPTMYWKSHAEKKRFKLLNHQYILQ